MRFASSNLAPSTIAGLGHWLIARLPSVAKGVRFLQSAPITEPSSSGQDARLSIGMTGVRIPLALPIMAGSFNGRTAHFECVYVGSNPTPATNTAAVRWRTGDFHKVAQAGSTPAAATNASVVQR